GAVELGSELAKRMRIAGRKRWRERDRAKLPQDAVRAGLLPERKLGPGKETITGSAAPMPETLPPVLQRNEHHSTPTAHDAGLPRLRRGPDTCADPRVGLDHVAIEISDSCYRGMHILRRHLDQAVARRG